MEDNPFDLAANNILKKSLLLIPDISGFTKFVNETEIIHGVHIISELLELIINNNILDLEVAEIEGDAVLFYKYTDSKPTPEEIFEQCKKMFLSFHQHIKLYGRDRVCNCGSCSSTPNLTLKFIIHYGDVIERNILGHFQLMGADVTTAHKLMKNNIHEDEYILVSKNSFLEVNDSNLPEWFNFKESSTEYKDIGKITYLFDRLTPLIKEVPELPERSFDIKHPLQLTIQRELNFNSSAVFDLVSRLDRKHEWVVGIKEIVYDPEKIERVGTKHECITPLNTLKIETIENQITEKKMVYAEFVEASGIFPESQQVFTVKETSPNTCSLILEIHFKSTVFNRLIFKRMIEFGLTKSFDKMTQVLGLEVKD